MEHIVVTEGSVGPAQKKIDHFGRRWILSQAAQGVEYAGLHAAGLRTPHALLARRLETH